MKPQIFSSHAGANTENKNNEMDARPSVNDWPAMAKDLIGRANKAPHYEWSKHSAVAGCFSEEGLPPIIVTCTLDIHSQGYKILHISFSIMGGSSQDLDNILQNIDQIVALFDSNPPYFYKGRDGHMNFCWPQPWEQRSAHEYLSNRTGVRLGKNI